MISNLTRRTFIGTSALTVGALATGLPGDAARAQGSVLKFVAHADLKNIDPIWTTAYITRNHGYMVYDTLFSMDASMQPQPQMVREHAVSEDGLTYTFTLRDGLKWHDGAPVTAEDCTASIRRWGQRDAMGQKLMANVARLEPTGENSFELVLSGPYGLVLDSLGKIDSNVCFMMPRRLAETDPYEQVPEIIGSGPFKFIQDEWDPGSKVVYVKNEDYVPRDEPPSGLAGGKRVHLDRVEWHYIPDAQTASNAVIAGEVDFWENIAHDMVPLLEQGQGVKVEVLDPLGSQGWLRVNHLHPPFDKPEARQALLWMADQEQYLRAAVGDPRFWQQCGAWFVCGSPNETDVASEPLMKQDLDKARELMQASGYDGRTVVVMDPTDIPVLHNVTLVTAQLLRDIGVEVEVQAMDWSTLTSRRAEMEPVEEGGWNIFHTWTVGVGAADPVLNSGVAANCDKAWFGWPCDEKTEQLRDAYSRAGDPEERKALVAELQQHLYEEVVPYVNFGQFFSPVAYRDNIEGVIESPIPVFWNVEKTA